MSALSTELAPDFKEATVMLRLRGSVDYREAPALRRAVFDAIAVARNKNLVIDLEQVERIDTAAMAVLVEALMATRGGDTTIFLLHPSQPVRDVFELAGLEEALTACCGCWEELATAMAV